MRVLECHRRKTMKQFFGFWYVVYLFLVSDKLTLIIKASYVANFFPGVFGMHQLLILKFFCNIKLFIKFSVSLLVIGDF